MEDGLIEMRITMKIDAYLNLHKDCVSVRSREQEDYGEVVVHRPKIHVSDVEFVVQPAGRAKARETGTKNVHAFVRGEWDDAKTVRHGTRVGYDPFGVGEFFEKESGRIVEGCDLACVTRTGVSAEGLRYADAKVEP